MIDLHAQILPGLDDGVATLEEARELARHAAGEGVTAIAATPRVRDDYPTTAAQMRQALAQVRDDFASEQIPVDVLPGAELAIDRLTQIPEEELQQLSLAGSGRYLLLEWPYRGWPPRVHAHLRRVVGNKRLAQWLTDEASAAIVAGESLPERPRRGWFGR